MKKTFLLLFIAALFAACSNKNNFTVEGSISSELEFAQLEGTRVYLQKIADDFETIVTLDSATITDGKFSLKGDANSAQLRFVILDPERLPGDDFAIPFLTEAGTIKMSFGYPNTLSGTPTNDAYNKLLVAELDMRVKLMDEYSALEERIEKQPDAADSLLVASEKENTEIQRGRNLVFLDFIKSNINNEFGKYLFVVSGKKNLDAVQVREALDVADAEFKELETVKKIVKRVQGMENSAEGKMFTDFTMQNPAGESVSLSDYAAKDKYVLLDFWASWCAPCRADIPHVIGLYNKYKNKGLEVIGVSLDNDRDAWLKAVEELKMPYVQMSDLLGMGSPAATLYGIEAIPFLLVLNKEGVIVAKDLRGKELDDKLAELLK